MYAANAKTFPNEYRMANLAGFPVAILKSAPKENICKT